MKVLVTYSEDSDNVACAQLIVMDRGNYVTPRIFPLRRLDNPAHLQNLSGGYLSTIIKADNWLSLEHKVGQFIKRIKELLEDWEGDDIPKDQMYEIG